MFNVNGNIVECDGEKYGEIDMYYPSEDWMEMQLDYTRYDVSKGDDPSYGRRFGTGGIMMTQITPDEMRVQLRMMDSSGAEYDLFYWNSEEDKTPLQTDGDVQMSAEFAWQLCHALEQFYENEGR